MNGICPHCGQRLDAAAGRYVHTLTKRVVQVTGEVQSPNGVQLVLSTGLRIDKAAFLRFFGKAES